MRIQKNVIFERKVAKDKKYCEVRIHCCCTGEYRGAAHSICNLNFNVLKEILIVFHNGSNCDYHFTIKQPAEEFTGQFTCSRESTENYKTFSVPIEKELNMKTMSCRLQFVHSGFMESS